MIFNKPIWFKWSHGLINLEKVTSISRDDENNLIKFRYINGGDWGSETVTFCNRETLEAYYQLMLDNINLIDEPPGAVQDRKNKGQNL